MSGRVLVVPVAALLALALLALLLHRGAGPRPFCVVSLMALKPDVRLHACSGGYCLMRSVSLMHARPKPFAVAPHIARLPLMLFACCAGRPASRLHCAGELAGQPTCPALHQLSP